jgi:hypothetical protein
MRRRTVRRIAVAAMCALAVLLVLNVVGVARYPGGPMRQDGADGPLWLDTWPSDWGNSPVGNTPEADWATTDTDLVFSTAWLTNRGAWPVTVERIIPAGVSGDLVTVDARVRADDTPYDDLAAFGPLDDAGRATLAGHFATLPLVIPPGVERQIALVVRGPKSGPAGFATLDVDYRVGPFAFRVVQHAGLEACLGATPEERDCPELD